MSTIKPSQVAEAIRTMFGFYATDLDHERPTYAKQVEVRALLSLLDSVPSELLNLPFAELLEFQRCCAALATILPRWTIEKPPRFLELFMTDEAVRVDTEAKIHAAWVNFKAGEWLGATVFSGCALEAILLWEVKHCGAMSASTANRKDLTALIDAARERDLISTLGANLAKLARDGRDLLHPGRVAREGTECTKATALTALAAVPQVAEELNRSLAAKDSSGSTE